MKIKYDNFIGFYDDVYSEGFCKHLINEFNYLQENGAGGNRLELENTLSHNKNDYYILMNLRNHTVNDFGKINTQEFFWNGLQKCFNHYVTEFSILKEEPIKASCMKMQKIPPGGGYHLWHSEQGFGEHSARVLVYTLYLNTLADGDGGETEFLYQKQRIKPKENLMLLWPAAFTHTHRGNLVLGSEYKYIVTGWFLLD